MSLPTYRDIQLIEPKNAPSIGIRTVDDWPYGPNISAESRVALVDWATQHGVRRSKSAWCQHWILGKNCQYHNTGTDWLDHTTGWCINRRRAIFVSQPYPTGTGIDSAREFAASNGLEITVDENSGWYGFDTVFIAVYDRNVISSVTA